MAILTRAGLLGVTARLDAELRKAAAASAALLVEAASAPIDASFDIFLSHSARHAREVRAIKRLFEKYGYTVYVDWIDDDDLERSKVTPATARRLRRRIAACTCLLVHATEGARLSRWFPWELGIADGLQRLVGILPVTVEARDQFEGSEYLGLYPYVDFAPSSKSNKVRPWVNESTSKYVGFRQWLQGESPHLR